MRILPYKDRSQVIEAVAHILSVAPVENLLISVQQFCLPIIERIHEIAHLPPQTDEIQKELIDLIDSFTVFLRYLQPNIESGFPHPCVSIIVDSWPALKQIMINYGQQEKLAEAGARFMRSTIISYRTFMSSILEEWANSLLEFFEMTGYGCWLWVCTKFVKFYGAANLETTRLAHGIAERATASFFKYVGQATDIDTLGESKIFKLISSH
jgi:transportin-3